jgi:iron complex transport system ATP-binding protein
MVDTSKRRHGVETSNQLDSSPSDITTSSLLEIEHITFGYNQQPLLYDVSLQIARSEMVGLLGPNGSGKTTLLRLISGILQPQQGQVVLDGRTLQQWGRRKVAQRIAVVPQELHMPFDFTVEQMVELGRTPFVKSFWGVRSIQDRLLIQESMRATGVDGFATRVFYELSGGERQRVTLAMALAQQPAVLLLDEPTSHLDIKYQVEILELAQQLNRERGVTIIAAIHDLNLAARYFPRLLLFQRGVVADAGPAEVLEPGLLSRVYGIQVQVGILRGSEHLSVLPPSRVDEHEVAQREESHSKPDPNSLFLMVHVIAGGGSGEVLMRALADVAIPFVAGALNIGDSDHTLALRLASKVITEQPFAPISPLVLKQVRESLSKARVLILCPTAIGPGNLALIEEAVYAAQQGLSVIVLNTSDIHSVCLPNDVTMDNIVDVPLIDVLDQSGIAARDYTGGEGIKLMGMLIEAGAVFTTSVSETLEAVKRYLDMHTVTEV